MGIEYHVDPERTIKQLKKQVSSLKKSHDIMSEHLQVAIDLIEGGNPELAAPYLRRAVGMERD